MTEETGMVVNAEDMSDENFAAHMNFRHTESLGGLPHIDLADKSPGLVEAWRAFHRRIHKLAMPGQMGHEHEPGPGESVQTGANRARHLRPVDARYRSSGR